MDFAMLPPEINSGRMYAGPGSGPLLTAAEAWDGLAADLYSTANAYRSVIAGLTAGPWLGPSSAAMTAAVAPYLAWMSSTAAQAEQTATQAKAAAAAYETAFAMTVAPSLVASNRSLLIALVSTNLFGQNTQAIAATESQYAEMWAQDAGAMYSYAGSSASATTLTPFTPPPNTTNPAGPAGEAAAATQTTGASAGTGAQTIASTGSQLLSAAPSALQGLAQPAPSASVLSEILDDLGFTTPQSFLSLFSLVTPYTGTLASVNLGIGSARLANVAGMGAAAAGAAAAGAAGEISPAAGALVPAGMGASTVTASMGQGAALAGLSVPPGWASAAPAFRTLASALPMTSANAAAAALTGSSGTVFSEMAAASMAGGAMGGSVGAGRGERSGSTTRTPDTTSPEQILAIRFARGEIDGAEYRERLAVLREHPPT